MDTNETRDDAAKMLRKYLEYGKNGDAIYEERCELRTFFTISGKREYCFAWLALQAMTIFIAFLIIMHYCCDLFDQICDIRYSSQ